MGSPWYRTQGIWRTTESRHRSNNLRLLSYNIFEGACSRGEDRTDAVIDVIRATNPNVVGLCECTDFWDDGAARLRRFESALGMRSVMTRAASGHHVALLYRDGPQIVKASASAVMMYNGYARIVLDLPTLGRVAVLMTHLHPCSSVFRLAEAQNLLAKATFEPNAIVMGDFNTLAASDALPGPDQLSANARARLQEPGGSLDCATVDLFLRHGFVDLCANAAVPTYPTNLFDKAKRSGLSLRVDYMFATPAVAQLAKVATIETPAAMTASDHLPLVCHLGDDP